MKLFQIRDRTQLYTQCKDLYIGMKYIKYKVDTLKTQWEIFVRCVSYTWKRNFRYNLQYLHLQVLLILRIFAGVCYSWFFGDCSLGSGLNCCRVFEQFGVRPSDNTLTSEAEISTWKHNLASCGTTVSW